MSEELAAHRYKVFKEQVYAALQSIKDRFHFHFIPADGTMDEVCVAAVLRCCCGAVLNG